MTFRYRFCCVFASFFSHAMTHAINFAHSAFKYDTFLSLGRIVAILMAKKSDSTTVTLQWNIELQHCRMVRQPLMENHSYLKASNKSICMAKSIKGSVRKEAGKAGKNERGMCEKALKDSLWTFLRCVEAVKNLMDQFLWFTTRTNCWFSPIGPDSKCP